MKTYRMPASGSEYCDVNPSMAIFSINEETAREIIKLAAIVKANGIYKVEKFDYRCQWALINPEEFQPESEDDENDLHTECDCLNVADDAFWFTAYVKHTDCKVSCDHVSIKTLAADFGLSNQPELTTVVVEMDGGAIHCVRASAPTALILLDADTEGSDEGGVQEVNGEDVYVHHYRLTGPANEGSDGIDPVFVSNVLDQIAETASVCSDCGTKVDNITGCPDGAEVCQGCFDSNRH